MVEEYLTKEGEAFIRSWYEKIDAKVDFWQIAAQTDEQELVVDFPNNPLGFKGFKNWYEGQCRDFTGYHQIESIHVTKDADLLVIFSEITWQAKNIEGVTLILYPNVTIKIRLKDGWKVVYYGCVDRK